MIERFSRDLALLNGNRPQIPASEWKVIKHFPLLRKREIFHLAVKKIRASYTGRVRGSYGKELFFSSSLLKRSII